MTKLPEKRSRRSYHPYQKATKTNAKLFSSEDDCHFRLLLTDGVLRGELLGAIGERKSTKEVSCYHLRSNLTTQEITHLLFTIAGLPQLEKFSLWTVQPLDLSILTNFVQQAEHIRAVSFQGVKLESWKGMASFTNALAMHPCLNRVCLEGVEIMAAGMTLDPLLHAITRNTRITSLRISMAASDEREMIADGDSLVRLCANNQLKHLSLWGVHLNDKAVESLANSLQSHSPVQTLTLRCCGLSPRSQQVLVKSFLGSSSLQTLDLGNERQPWTKTLGLMDSYLNLDGEAGTSQDLLKKERLTQAKASTNANATFHLVHVPGETMV